MKRQATEDKPLRYIERNPLVVVVLLMTAAGLLWSGIGLIMDREPAGFLVMVPAVFFTFTGLWTMLNPFATFFENRVEIRQSLFHFRQAFYRDLKGVSGDHNGVVIVYNDDDTERLNLFGIRNSDRKPLKDTLAEQVGISLLRRDP